MGVLEVVMDQESKQGHGQTLRTFTNGFANAFGQKLTTQITKTFTNKFASNLPKKTANAKH